MKVLVTGATGFVGGYVINELLKQKHLTIIASASNELKARETDWFNKVVFIPHNINETGDTNLFKKFNEPDLMIHLAWGGLPNFKDDVHITEVLPKHKEFLSNILQNGLKNLTVTGTCLEYGMIEGELNEEMETNPSIAYPLAKKQLFTYLNLLKAKHTFCLKWVRLFYMYGKGQTPKSIIPQLQQAIDKGDKVFNMSKGDQLRDYLPVEKIAENIVIFALQCKTEGIINCCSGKPLSVKQLVTNYLKSINKNIELNLGYYPYPDYEPFGFWGNNNKQQQIITDYESNRRV